MMKMNTIQRRFRPLLRRRGCVAVLAVAALAMAACRQTTFDDQAEAQAAEFTAKQCPMKIADGVVVDSMTYSKSLRCISYFYTMSGAMDDAKLVQGNLGMLREGVLTSVQNSVELKRAKDEGVTFRYVYLSAKTHRQMASIVIRKADYSAPASK